MEESINLSAWLGCNVKQAFKMFTNKDHLMEWLPLVADVEPREGGKYEISWIKEKPLIECKILIYEPNKYIMFEWKVPVDKSSKHSSKLDTQVTIYFLPMDSQIENIKQFTEVHLIHTILDDSDDDEEIKLEFESTWTNAFEKLIEHVNDIFKL